MFRPRKPKYEFLTHVKLGPGISPERARQRMNLGWSFERATTEPVHHGLKKTRTKRLAELAAKRKKQQGRYASRLKRGQALSNRTINSWAEDTSPPHIREIREALCAEFMKTGDINGQLVAKLKDYADEFNAAKRNPSGVSAKLGLEGDGRPQRRHRDDGDRNDPSAGAGIL